MVLGPASSGKSTMVKNLVNLATGSGMGWAPAVVGLDPGNVSGFLLCQFRAMIMLILSRFASQIISSPAH